MTKITYIPGEIANAAIDEHGNRKPVTRTHHIFDDAKDKNQAEVNAEVDDTFAFHQSEINALNSQNYVTVDSFGSLPATGAVDTVYRVSNWDGTQQDPSVYSEYAWNGEDYVHLSTKTQINEVFDISAYHATGGELAKYADLAAALGNNGANIPQSLQKGGMRVQFVQSSDNKYIRYNLLADSFTTDTTQWAIAEEGVYVENPEFVYVKTDAQNKILLAIKTDGTVYFGTGVPQQVVDYIREKIEELSLDEYEDIVAFLNGLEEGENTLQQLLNLKANKANPELSGKVSLDKEIGENDEVIEASVQHIDSPEFVAVWLDKDDKILFGIQVDGNFLFGCGVPMQLIDFVNSIKAELLNTLQPQIDTLSGDKVDKVEGKSLIDSEFAASQSVVENSEYMEVETDLEDRILGGRKIDGTKFENLPMEFKDKVSFNGNTIENTNDLEERMAMLTDSKGAILSYRDKDGFLHEEVGFDSKKGKNYLTVKNAVIAKKEGIIQVGENVVVGLKALSYPYTNKDIEDNYKVTLPAPVFPYIKSISLHRLYDDAAEPNMLYICSHSDKHIFYSICPTDVYRAVHQEGYYTKYNANYFYYANKETPSNIHKVVLPNTVDGRSMDRRITFVFEMSNGECLLEIANGEPIAAGSTAYHHNIYRVSNVFSENTLQESDFTLSLSFDYYLEKVSAFDNITEGKAGMIIAAPYWGGTSGQVYVSHNYGGTWDLIFCSNPNNTHYIKPKAEHFGEENAYGRYPTPNLLNPEGELDWNTALESGNIHVHGIAYDPWYDRIWIVTGDGAYNKFHNVTGIWWTDDEGYTWKRIGGGKEIGTQLIGIIPMEHCVLFPTDGAGNGFWRWSRNGADSIISIENCYNYTNGSALQIVGGRTTKTKSGFSIASFVPEGDDTWIHKGGLVATPNGFDFYKIYEDTFTEGTEETAELGWCCDVTDCGDKLIVGAYQGGYIELKY